MSHSPVDDRFADTERYLAGWRAINTLIREGGSWSGRERNCAFLNIGGTRFADVSAVAGWDFPDDARSVAIVDWDLDGSLDVWVSNRTGPRVRFLRNAGSTGNGYMAVRLQGRSCNRDAIGARLELVLRGDPTRRIIKTVHAGEGYLAQSSRWVHFGLGAKGEPEKLIVRWPGGGTEEFSDLEPNRRYQIIQGSAHAEVWRAPRRRLALQPSQPTAPAVSDRARIVLVARMPMPEVDYQGENGAALSLANRTGKPALINIWASWCANCQEELASLVANEKQLRAIGIRVLALSADEPESRAAAVAKLKQLRWPFESGYATEEVLGVLDVVQRALLERKRPLPIPSSFLVDGQNRLAVIYKGPVKVTTLVQDVADLALSAAERRSAAVPFPGRWYWPTRDPNMVQMAQEFNKRGYPTVAKQYLSGLDALRPSDIQALDDATRDRLANAAYNLGTNLFMEGKQEEGIAALQKSIEIDPTYWRPYQNLGIIFAELGRQEEAFQLFETQIRLQPSRPELHLNAGRSLAAIGRFDDARSHFEAMLRARPNNGAGLLNLAKLHASQGRLDEAVRLLQDAILHHSESVSLRLAVADVYLKMRRMEEAADQYREVIKLDPERQGVHYRLGVVTAQLGLLEEAITAIRRALELSPETFEIERQLGGLLIMQGQYEEAIELLTAASSRNPADVRAINNLAIAHLRSGDPDAALQLHDKLDALDAALAAKLLTMIEEHAAG